MRSQLQEYDYWITDIEGQVPTALRGTLFRNGPGRLIILLFAFMLCLLDLCIAADHSLDHLGGIGHLAGSASAMYHALREANKTLVECCRFERGGQEYHHKLDGDGYVCSFSFNEEGKAHFRSAYVQTR